MKRILIILSIALVGQYVWSQTIVDTKWEGRNHGFVDAHGNWVGRNDYDYTYWNPDVSHGMFEDNNDKYGVVNKYGKVVVPARYKFIDLQPSCIVTEDDGGMKGAISYDTYKQIYPNKYDDLNAVFKGYVTLQKGNKYGVGDDKGNIFAPVEYDYISESRDWNNDVFFDVSKGGTMKGSKYIDGKTWGLYKIGQLIVPCEYDTILSAKEDIYPVRRNGKWGFYGNGRELILPQYDAVTEFSNGVATVRKDGEVKMIKNPLLNADDIQIAGGGPDINNKKTRGPVVSRYPAPDSDVDKDIPLTNKVTENSFAFIICNENYPDAPVPYSLNDGRMFREYCQKTLGLPEKNINIYEDATFGNIITAVEKMKQIADAYDGDASIIFYYAGHGFPDDKQQTAYLLPIDGDASSITTTGYSLAKLYGEIASLNLKSSVVFLDACFSGAKREDQMLASSRGVAIKVKEEAPQGKMVVFSAAQGDETAHQMEDKHHGLFTYYLLKELQATQGDVDLGTLTDYVTKQVKRQSVVINNKKQTPTVIPSSVITEVWRGIKLK